MITAQPPSEKQKSEKLKSGNLEKEPSQVGNSQEVHSDEFDPMESKNRGYSEILKSASSRNTSILK